MPAPSRLWMSEDYAKAAQVLLSGRVPLPRYSSKDGADVLARLNALENLSFFLSPTLPVQRRMEDYNQLFNSLRGIWKLYASAESQANPPETEYAAQVAFLLHVSATGIELIDEYLAAIPRDDLYASRLEGLKTVKKYLTLQFATLERSIATSNEFAPRERSMVLNAMSDTLPVLKRAFAPDYKLELSLNLRADRELSKDTADRELYDTMIKELGK